MLRAHRRTTTSRSSLRCSTARHRDRAGNRNDRHLRESAPRATRLIPSKLLIRPVVSASATIVLARPGFTPTSSPRDVSTISRVHAYFRVRVGRSRIPHAAARFGASGHRARIGAVDREGSVVGIDYVGQEALVSPYKRADLQLRFEIHQRSRPRLKIHTAIPSIVLFVRPRSIALELQHEVPSRRRHKRTSNRTEIGANSAANRMLRFFWRPPKCSGSVRALHCGGPVLSPPKPTVRRRAN